jgi:hypothetical protein
MSPVDYGLSVELTARLRRWADDFETHLDINADPPQHDVEIVGGGGAPHLGSARLGGRTVCRRGLRHQSVRAVVGLPAAQSRNSSVSAHWGTGYLECAKRNLLWDGSMVV